MSWFRRDRQSPEGIARSLIRRSRQFFGDIGVPWNERLTQRAQQQAQAISKVLAERDQIGTRVFQAGQGGQQAPGGGQGGAQGGQGGR